MLAQTVFDYAAKAGTLPMQVLLLACIIILGLVLRALHREHGIAVSALVARMESKDEAITNERRQRIDSLMTMIHDDTRAKMQIATAIEVQTRAVGDNTNALRDLQVIMTEMQLTMKMKT